MASLLPYQVPHVAALEKLFLEDPARALLDGSDMGTGKTFCAAELAHRLALKPCVVCPKVSIPGWKRILAEFGLNPMFVLGYEQLRNGNTKWGKWNGPRWVWCDEIKSDPNVILLLDEAHRGKGDNSQTAKLFRDSKGIRTLLMSASIADSPLDMHALAHLLGLCDWRDWFRWLLKNGCKRGPFAGMIFLKSQREKVLKRLHAEIFGPHGSRMRIADLGDAFPESQITADAYDLGDAKAYQKIFDEMEKELAVVAARVRADRTKAAAAAGIDEEDVEDHPLTLQLRARQKTELLKVPGIVTMTNDLVAEGKSVVIFVNFKDSLEALCAKLKTRCAIFGNQDPDERQSCIDRFQADLERVIVVNVQAGGESISLHDVLGNFPRVALICPCQSSYRLKQVFGRVWRAGGKSKSLQRLIFAAGTIEERVCKRVQGKLHNLDLLNDGDLSYENTLNETPTGGSSPLSGISCPLTSTVTMTQVLPVGTIMEEPPADRPTASCETSAIEPSLNKVEAAPPAPPAEEPDHGARAHAKHSPSKWATLVKCEGFENDPDRDTSAADKGTRGHQAIEARNAELVKEEPDLYEAVQKCLKLLKRFMGGIVHQEIRLPILDQHGFLDLLIISKEDPTFADMLDWKFAQASFYAADSPQFWGYTLGAFDAYPQLQTIKVWVCNPFRDEIDVHVFTREADYERLWAYGKLLIMRANNPDPTRFKIGKHCDWCRKLGTCTKWAEIGSEIATRYAGDEAKFAFPAGSLHGSEIEDPAALAVLKRISTTVQGAAEGWSKAALAKAQEGVEIRDQFGSFELYERAGKRSITSAVAAFAAVKERIPAETLLEAADLKMGELETLWKATYPRGEKEKSLPLLMSALREVEAVSRGTPSMQLRESRK